MINQITMKEMFFCAFFVVLLLGGQSLKAQQAKYRSIDGTGNNLTNTKWGAAGIPLFREIPAEYGPSDPKNALGGANRPSARHISNRLSDEVEDIQNARDMSGLAYIWGQFLDHDITLTPGGSESAPIPIPSYEPIFTSPIPFRRSAVFPGTGITTPREQGNDQTSWIDGSQVYGANAATAKWLRTFKEGKLKVSAGNLLPYNTLTGEFDSALDPTAPKMDDDNNRTKKTFAAGDPRAAEHPGLTSLHTLFLREHNRICDELKIKGGTDEEIYQTARKKVGALIQVITYGQWISTFGVQLSSYAGYKPSARPDITNLFSTASYRWHTMVENDIIFRNNDCHGVGPVELPLKNIFFNIEFVKKFDIGILLKGLTVHQQYETDLKVNSGLRNFLFGQGSGFDLVSLNIQRGRDHGLPNYNTVRKFYTGSAASSFSDIASKSKVAAKMQELFGNVNNVDLWVGLYAESLLSGKSLGKTVDAIFRVQLQNLRDGDFYYFLNDPALSAEAKTLQSTTLGDVIARNSNAGSLQSNVFQRKHCDSNGDDLNDSGQPVCTGSACSVYATCGDSKGGVSLTPGTYTLAQLKAKGLKDNDISQINVNIGFAVTLYDGDNFAGKATYYAGNTGCLPVGLDNTTSSLKVICLSNDASTVNCSGFGGSLFDTCFNSGVPLPAGTYTAEQLTTFDIKSKTTSGIRVNNGFSITLYNKDKFSGNSITFTGPTVVCLPTAWNDTTQSVKVTCLSNPSFGTTCALAVAGGIFDTCSNTSSNLLHEEGISVGVGDYTSSRLQAMGMKLNGIAKVLVHNGFAFTLYEFDNFTGKSQTYTGKQCVPSGLAKQFRALRVSCLSPAVIALATKEEFVLNAKAEVNRARIQWISNTGYKTDYYIVEKFNPNIGDFEPIATENAILSDKGEYYTVYDNAPNEGDNIYRIRIHLQDGTRQISENKIVNFQGLSDALIFPNPAHSAFNIDLTEYKDKPVEITLYNTIGQLVLVHKVAKVENTLVELDVSNQEAGNYRVRIQSKGKRDIIKSVVIAR